MHYGTLSARQYTGPPSVPATDGGQVVLAALIAPSAVVLWEGGPPLVCRW